LPFRFLFKKKKRKPGKGKRKTNVGEIYKVTPEKNEIMKRKNNPKDNNKII